MKLFFKLIVLLTFIWSSNTFGQSKGFSYQALILDTSTIEVPSTDIQPQIPLGNEPVGLRISIIKSISGVETIEYLEERIVLTDDNGMISIIVGPDQDGVIVGSSALNFDEIDWNGEKMYLNVELNIVSSTSGFFPLEKQEIVYMPHPANPLDIYNDEFDLLSITDKKSGDLVWVKDADGSTNSDGTTNPSIFILNELDTWVPVLNDYDPENELKLITVADDLERNTRFSPPLVGDQVFNLAYNRIEVYNGLNWITILSNINLKASNGLSINSTNPDEPEVELGGALTQPATTIAASPINTLAITGLDAVTDLNDEVILSDPTSGVLKKITFDDLFLNKAIEILSDPSAIPLLTDKKQGDLIWVQDVDGSINADGTSNPSLFILIAEPNTWAPITNDFNPENELKLITVPTETDRDFLFSPAQLGDQAFIEDSEFIQVYNGSTWITILSTKNLEADNGLSYVNEVVELGGTLTKPTVIGTTTNETIAITGLDAVTDLNDEVIVSDPASGLLKKITFDDIFLNKAITILADATGIASLIDKNQGDLIWVKNYDGNINPTLLIFDDTSAPLNPLFPWVPVTNDFDPENELRASIDILDNNAALPTDKLQGDLVWVRDYNNSSYPTLLILDGTGTWIPVNSDFDLDNERNIKTVADIAERDSFFSTPQAGDQVFIISNELFQVYDGAIWVNIKSLVSVADDIERDIVFPTPQIGNQVFITNNNTLQVYSATGGGSGWINIVNASSLDVENGLLVDSADGKLKLGGPLTQQTIITTDPTATAPLTLAITNLENKNTILNDGFVLVDPITGVLTSISAADFLVENSVQIYANSANLPTIDNKTGDLAWVLEFRNSGNPTMFIYDSTGNWRPIIRNSKLFEYADEPTRDADFTTISGEAGDQVYISGVGVQVFDGANWVTLLSKTKTAITSNLLTLAAVPVTEIGSTIWVKNADGNNNPALFIVDDTNMWVPVNNDFDPENERKIKTVDDVADRNSIFTTPQAGDQVFITLDELIQVYDGTEWVNIKSLVSVADDIERDAVFPLPQIGDQVFITNNNTLQVYSGTGGGSGWINIVNASSLDVENGLLVDSADGKLKLGGLLTQPTTITTNPAAPLAITNLDNKTSILNDGFILVDPATGVLTTISAADFLLENSSSVQISNTFSNLPTTGNETGDLAWVLEFRNPGNPTMFIFDSNGDWRPIIRNSKLFEYADEATRNADFITSPGEAGDQVYITGVGVQVFDGTNWITLLSKTKTAITPDLMNLNLLPSPELGTTVWVEDADGKNNPSLFIYDNTNTWVPVNNDFDTENEKLIVISDDVNRDIQFPSPVAGDQFFNLDLNSIDVYDGAGWISASNSTEIVLNIAALPAVPTPETGTTIWVEDADGNNNPSLFIFDNANNWVPVNNKRIIVDVAANRAAQFPSPVAGDQFFNVDLNSIDVYDGTAWISASNPIEIVLNIGALPTVPTPETGTTIWVENADGNNNPSLFIYDNTNNWVPVNNKRIIVDVAANRATKFPSPVAGDQFFNLDLNSIDVYDGTAWIEQFSIAKTERFASIGDIPASLEELNAIVLVSNYSNGTISTSTPTLVIYDGTDWMPAANYLEADNGLTIDPVNGKIEIGGVLNKPTSIETSSTETLAIEGLIDSIDPADKFLVVDGAGVMSTRDPSDLFGIHYFERYGTVATPIDNATANDRIFFDAPGIVDPNYTSTPYQITVLHDGEYVITYRVTSVTTTYINQISIDFAAFKADNSTASRVIIPGSVSSSTYKAVDDRVTVTATRIVFLLAGESISVGANVLPNSSTSEVETVPNGSSLRIIRIK